MGASKSQPVVSVYYDGCRRVVAEPVCMDNPDLVIPPPAAAQPPAPTPPPVAARTCDFRGCKLPPDPILQTRKGRCTLTLQFLPVPYDALTRLHLTSDLKLGRIYTPIVKLRFCRHHGAVFLEQLKQAIKTQLGNYVAQELGDFLLKQVINVYGGALGFDPQSTDVWQEAVLAECA